jgi:hypothetical protein
VGGSPPQRHEKCERIGQNQPKLPRTTSKSRHGFWRSPTPRSCTQHFPLRAIASSKVH